MEARQRGEVFICKSVSVCLSVCLFSVDGWTLTIGTQAVWKGYQEMKSLYALILPAFLSLYFCLLVFLRLPVLAFGLSLSCCLTACHSVSMSARLSLYRLSVCLTLSLMRCRWVLLIIYQELHHANRPTLANLYFIAPRRFSGNQRLSYGQKLRFRFRITSGRPQASREDVVIKGKK